MGAHEKSPPVVARDADGAFTIDAAMLAERFGWSVGEMRGMMRRGLVTSLVERGEDEDAGRWRLSVRCGNRRWRAVVEPDGAIARSHMDFVARQKEAAVAVPEK